METTTTTVDIATAANYEANAVVERLLKRDQGMFDSAEVLAVLDLVDTAVSLATDADPAKLATLAEVSACSTPPAPRAACSSTSGPGSRACAEAFARRDSRTGVHLRRTGVANERRFFLSPSSDLGDRPGRNRSCARCGRTGGSVPSEA